MYKELNQETGRRRNGIASCMKKLSAAPAVAWVYLESKAAWSLWMVVKINIIK